MFEYSNCQKKITQLSFQKNVDIQYKEIENSEKMKHSPLYHHENIFDTVL